MRSPPRRPPSESPPPLPNDCGRSRSQRRGGDEWLTYDRRNDDRRQEEDRRGGDRRARDRYDDKERRGGDRERERDDRYALDDRRGRDDYRCGGDDTRGKYDDRDRRGGDRDEGRGDGAGAREDRRGRENGRGDGASARDENGDQRRLAYDRGDHRREEDSRREGDNRRGRDRYEERDRSGGDRDRYDERFGGGGGGEDRRVRDRYYERDGEGGGGGGAEDRRGRDRYDEREGGGGGGGGDERRGRDRYDERDKREDDPSRASYDRRGDNIYEENDRRGGDDRRVRNKFDDRENRGGEREDERGDARARDEIDTREPTREEKPQRKRKSKWDEPTPPPEMPVMNPGIIAVGLKPELCADFTKGHCKNGDTCIYAHNLRELAPGGIKHRLCPEYDVKGGCPRKNLCFYAHTKEELSPNFKCQLCNKFTNGNCRSAQMCKLAHGEEELEFFLEFMKGDTRSKYSKKPSQSNSMFAGLANMGNVNSFGSGGLATPSFPMRPKPPAHTPKLNVAKLPAMMKAPGLVQAGTMAKGSPMMGGPAGLTGALHNAGMQGPPGLANPGMQNVGLFGNSFAKRPANPSQPDQIPQTFNAAAFNNGGLSELMSSIMAANRSQAAMSPPAVSPPAQAKPAPEPKANAMMERIAALQKQASQGMCLQFAMGNCSNANCSFSHG